MSCKGFPFQIIRKTGHWGWRKGKRGWYGNKVSFCGKIWKRGGNLGPGKPGLWFVLWWCESWHELAQAKLRPGKKTEQYLLGPVYRSYFAFLKLLKSRPWVKKQDRNGMNGQIQEKPHYHVLSAMGKRELQEAHWDHRGDAGRFQWAKDGSPKLSHIGSIFTLDVLRWKFYILSLMCYLCCFHLIFKNLYGLTGGEVQIFLH